MRALNAFLFWATVAILLPRAALAQAGWDEATSNIVRLHPVAFPELPPYVRSALDRLGCAVPQPWGSHGPRNIISGSFAREGQTDWAALCSSDGLSAIVVLWGGTASCPSPIAPPLEDRKFLQDTGVDGILFSRGIDRVRPHLGFWTGPEEFAADSVTHDAISDAFFEKGSTAYYCEGGSWIEFGGGH